MFNSGSGFRDREAGAGGWGIGARAPETSASGTRPSTNTGLVQLRSLNAGSLNGHAPAASTASHRWHRAGRLLRCRRLPAWRTPRLITPALSSPATHSNGFCGGATSQGAVDLAIGDIPEIRCERRREYPHHARSPPASRTSYTARARSSTEHSRHCYFFRTSISFTVPVIRITGPVAWWVDYRSISAPLWSSAIKHTTIHNAATQAAPGSELPACCATGAGTAA